VESLFGDNYGDIEKVSAYPIDHAGAKKWLHKFLEVREGRIIDIVA
jgi:hypothetical protein